MRNPLHSPKCLCDECVPLRSRPRKQKEQKALKPKRKPQAASLAKSAARPNIRTAPAPRETVR